MFINLDVKDRKILRELELDARQPAVTIGNKIGVASDVVQYRIKRLEEKGVLKFYMCYVNIAKLSLVDYGLYISTKHMSKKDEVVFVDAITAHKHVHYFSRLGGSYEYLVGMISKDPISLYHMLNKLNEQFGIFIDHIDITTRIFVEHFPKRYLIDVNAPAQTVSFGGTIEQSAIDELDHKIIVALSKSPRERITTIAEQLKEPHSTITARLRQLEKNKIITGYFAWIEPQSYGYESYNLLIKTKYLSESYEKRLLHFSQAHPHVTWIIKTLGPWDYELGVEVEKQETLQEVIGELKDELGDVLQRVEFVTIFSTMKYVPYPLENHP